MDPRFFIYCNFCTSNAYDDRNTKKYFLEKCGKVFCEDCVKSKACNKCGANSAKRVIDKTLPADVAILFQDPTKKLNGVTSTVNYQMNRLKTQIQMLKAEKNHNARKFRDLQDAAKSIQKKCVEQGSKLTAAAQQHAKDKQTIQQLQAQLTAARQHVFQPPQIHNTTPSESFRVDQLNFSNGNQNFQDLSFADRSAAMAVPQNNSNFDQLSFNSRSNSHGLRSSTPLSHANIHRNTSSAFVGGSHVAPSMISRRSRIRFQETHEVQRQDYNRR